MFGAYYEYTTYHTTSPGAFPEQGIVYPSPRNKAWYDSLPQLKGMTVWLV
jgi:hypothetical protein